jgi:hypothetical protein
VARTGMSGRELMLSDVRGMRPRDVKAMARERQAARKQAVREWRRERRAIKYRGAVMARPVVWLAAVQAWAFVCSLPPYGWAISAGVSLSVGALMLAGKRVSPTVAALACLWLAVASWLGPFGWSALALWAGGVALAAPYWHRNHTSLQPPAPHEEGPPPTDAGLTPEQKTWAARIAVKG